MVVVLASWAPAMPIKEAPMAPPTTVDATSAAQAPAFWREFTMVADSLCVVVRRPPSRRSTALSVRVRASLEAGKSAVICYRVGYCPGGRGGSTEFLIDVTGYYL